MNTVIKSIIEQASNAQKFTIPKPENVFREGMLARYEVDVDRVAELMIEECIRNLQANGYDDAADSVKQHFGKWTMTTETVNNPITVKQYLEIFKFSNQENLKHIKWVLFKSVLDTQDLKNRYDAVKIALGEKL
jgi:hypothetical protein